MRKNTPAEDLIEDFKCNILRRELISLMGQEFYDKLIGLFNDKFDEILIRRCCAYGKFINFHTDVSLKTLQLALNDETEYEGGRLMYLIDGKVNVPPRTAGSITIHHNDIVHGVTKLHSGTRYGLFLLKKTV